MASSAFLCISECDRTSYQFGIGKMKDNMKESISVSLWKISENKLILLKK